MNRRLLALVGASVLLATTIISGATSGAAVVERHCTITFSPNPADVGQVVTVGITGFDAGESFHNVVTSDGSPVTSGTFAADSSGTYSSSFTITDNLAGMTLDFAETGETSGATCSGALAINAVSPPSSVVIVTADPTTTSTAPAAEKAAVKATPAFTG